MHIWGQVMRLQQFRSMLCLAGVLTLGAVSKASMFDATINISKALNNSTITISYSGVHAAVAELSIDGVSIASRSLNYAKTSGESDFTIDKLTLQPGQNQCVITLYDKAGRVVGTRSTSIDVTENTPQAFFLSTPKMGQTIEGPVQISVGFNQNFTNPYVSFFVDNQLKSMSNTPPFTYLWDTARATNGWHTIQSWMVSNDTTLKSPLLKVFVNNPSGDTPRKAQPDSRQTQPDARVVPTKASTHIAKPIVKNLEAVIPPMAVFNGILSLNQIHMTIVPDSKSMKAIQIEKPVMAGTQHMMPTGNRYALVRPVPQEKISRASLAPLSSAISALRFLSITDGVHLPALPNFSIFLNGAPVQFDVQPRVDNGVPMTPLRYLIQQDGGSVKWQNITKTVTAKDRGEGMWLQIGNSTAKVNNKPIKMEKAPYISGSRTIVPLSFIHDALHVNVQYDKKTDHVLITNAKK